MKVWRNGQYEDLSDQELSSTGKLLSHLNVAARVVSTKRKIKLTKYREFCRQTHIQIVRLYPWALFSESLHRLLDHTWEQILLNDCYGLANESEQSMESSHKTQRYLKEHCARKTSLKDNLSDQLRRDWASGDPLLRKFDRKPKCTRCQEDGHWTRGCPSKKTREECEEEDEERNDDLVVSSLILQNNEEEPHDQITLMEQLKEGWRL